MDTRSIAAVLLKVTGLLLIVFSVSQLPAYFPLTGSTYGFSIAEVLSTTAIALGPLTLVGLLLWFFPGTLTNKIVSSAPSDPGVADVRPIEQVALTILGVYLGVHAIIGGARDVILFVVVNRQNGNLGAVPASVIAHAGATVVEAVIGAILCIGARGVSRIIERLRR